MWAFVAVAVALIYGLLKWINGHWKRAGVPGPDPTILVGNIGPSLSSSKHIGEIYTNIYKNYKGCKYVGFFKFLSPGIIVRDPELVKSIMVKDYQCFDRNDVHVDENVDPLLGRNPFALTGIKWKAVRNQWTPNFTVGKLKAIFPLLEEVGDKMVKYLEKHNECQLAKDLILKQTTENVASCAFGLDAKAFTEEESDFIRIARTMQQVTAITVVKMALSGFMPFLAKYLPIRFFSKECAYYLMNVIKQTLNHRKLHNIVRNDFLQFMSKQKERCTEYQFDDADILAQAAGFFVDGVETSTNATAYTLYDIASHPDVQAKILKEINDKVEKYGKLCYEAVQEMTYLDCVLYESMRTKPSFVILGKCCTKDYKLPPATENGNKVTIRAGTPVIIPIGSLQMDEEYFPNPEAYIPERHLEANKDQITKYTFMPFGEGPRICLGMKFGMLQMKMGIISILMNFDISLNKKTITPLIIDKTKFLWYPKGGIWLDFHKRQ